jgi:cob(I)alamin adenosyltransferase
MPEPPSEEIAEAPRPDPKRRHGLIIVNTGDGKGKTTAALGLAFRALGCGFKVFMVQFIKGKWKTGEKRLADRLAPDIEIRPMGDGFTWDTKNPAQDIATTLKIWETGKEAIASGRYDLVILDEINVVMKLGYLDPQPVVDFLKARDPRQHVVLTGRGAPAAIVEAADLVSEVVPIKHPYKSGIKAQQGIEF